MPTCSIQLRVRSGLKAGNVYYYDDGSNYPGPVYYPPDYPYPPPPPVNTQGWWSCQGCNGQSLSSGSLKTPLAMCAVSFDL